jgi:hypothetical protein
MRRVIASCVAALLGSAALLAQQAGGGAGAAPAPTCPASGYGAQGYYALFAQNEDGFTAYELASPCVGKDVREVAESIGMGRGKVMGIKNVIGASSGSPAPWPTGRERPG